MAAEHRNETPQDTPSAQDRGARNARKLEEHLTGLPELPDAVESMGLASRARDGDREALDALLSRHEPWLRRVARIELGANLRRHVDSLDVVQEVGLVAFQRIGELRLTNPASVRRWLRGILGYHLRDVVDRLTAQKRDVRREVGLRGPRPWDSASSGAFDLAASQSRPDEQAEKLEMRELLDELVAELPDEQRAVVLLRDFDHADWEEIRETLGKQTTAAARQLHRRAWVRILDQASRRMKPS